MHQTEVECAFCSLFTQWTQVIYPAAVASFVPSFNRKRQHLPHNSTEIRSTRFLIPSKHISHRIQRCPFQYQTRIKKSVALDLRWWNWQSGHINRATNPFVRLLKTDFKDGCLQMTPITDRRQLQIHYSREDWRDVGSKLSLSTAPVIVPFPCFFVKSPLTQVVVKGQLAGGGL